LAWLKKNGPQECGPFGDSLRNQVTAGRPLAE
jgi:hypothetical protein